MSKSSKLSDIEEGIFSNRRSPSSFGFAPRSMSGGGSKPLVDPSKVEPQKATSPEQLGSKSVQLSFGEIREIVRVLGPAIQTELRKDENDPDPARRPNRILLRANEKLVGSMANSDAETGSTVRGNTGDRVAAPEVALDPKAGFKVGSASSSEKEHDAEYSDKSAEWLASETRNQKIVATAMKHLAKVNGAEIDPNRSIHKVTRNDGRIEFVYQRPAGHLGADPFPNKVIYDPKTDSWASVTKGVIQAQARSAKISPAVAAVKQQQAVAAQAAAKKPPAKQAAPAATAPEEPMDDLDDWSWWDENEETPPERAPTEKSAADFSEDDFVSLEEAEEDAAFEEEFENDSDDDDGAAQPYDPSKDPNELRPGLRMANGWPTDHKFEVGRRERDDRYYFYPMVDGKMAPGTKKVMFFDKKTNKWETTPLPTPVK